MADSKGKVGSGTIITTVRNGRVNVGIMGCTLGDVEGCMTAIARALYENGVPGSTIVFLVADAVIQLEEEKKGNKV